MPFETVGIRRLYGAPAFQFEGVGQFEYTFQFDDSRTVTVRIGSSPAYGFVEITGDTFYAPGGKSAEAKIEVHDDATELLTGFSNFMELLVTFPLEVEVDVSTRFRTRTDDAVADAAVVNGVLKHRRELEEIADIVAGLIGLRIHRQLVFRLLNGHTMALRAEKPVRGQLLGPVVEILDDVRGKPAVAEGLRARRARLEQTG